MNKAKEILLNHKLDVKMESIPILDSLNYILAQDIVSGIDMPPFDRSPLDGYAFKSHDTAEAGAESPVVLEVVDSIQAGYVTDKILQAGQAVRLMTGAKIPQGADAVIRYEDTVFSPEQVKIFAPVKADSNIVRAGEDMHRGELVIKKGKKISPADIGILATLGQQKVQVYRRPKVGIFATGDELVNIDEELTDGKIRNSNSYTVGGLVKKIGCEPKIFATCQDDQALIERQLRLALEWGDAVITTGGVSVGDADLVRDAFIGIGAEILFWKVNMKPGSPIAVAKFGDKLLFGLSGNPAAAYITFEKFVRPTLLRLAGESQFEFPQVESVLENGFTKVSKTNRMVRGTTYYKDGQFHTRLADKHSSGVLSNLSGTNSLLLVPPQTGPYNKGDKVVVELLDPIQTRD